MNNLSPALVERPDLDRFLYLNGRLPRCGETPQPWEYKGWLTPYLLFGDSLPAMRWNWFYGVREAGTISKVSGPIPRLHFGEPAADATRTIKRCLEIIEYRSGAWNAMREFIDWLCFALALGDERPALSESVNEALYKEFNLNPLLAAPSDYLGYAICERRGNGWNPNAFYPTPHPVCEMMILMQMTGADLSATVSDPCVGTGRMLLHASNYSLRLYGCDIDELMCKCTKINGALYAPWLVRPLPDAFFDKQPEPVREVVLDSRGQALLFNDSRIVR